MRPALDLDGLLRIDFGPLDLGAGFLEDFDLVLFEFFAGFGSLFAGFPGAVFDNAFDEGFGSDLRVGRLPLALGVDISMRGGIVNCYC